MVILNFLESINIKIPRLKAEQFLRLKEDKVFKSNWENHIFKIKPTSFEKGIDSQINSLMKNDYFSSNIIFRDYDHL